MLGLWPRRTKRKSVSNVTKAYLRHKPLARKIIKERVDFYVTTHGFVYKRIAIRNQRRSWGSCSSLGNLNFSYKLLFLPPCLRDYIVVHELCHLRELNHSKNYWAEVASIMPDYQERIRELRAFEKKYGTSVRVLEKLSESHQVACCEKCGHNDSYEFGGGQK